ncbi:antibiotic biosynthesis monooxygenase [Paracoccus sp. (in: a-proteobacteria)]|uniref:antibiotic biosynthesis monooxygenase family protein n=1 Tax=Paracoccus sp. TaxID=267 RepID=UPI00321FD657
MYIAMNRFKVRAGAEDEFETIWKTRETRLNGMAGFRTFHLLRGATDQDQGYTLYATHTVWDSETAFTAWTRSPEFGSSHRDSGSGRLLMDGHPRFEGFHAVEGA